MSWKNFRFTLIAYILFLAVILIVMFIMAFSSVYNCIYKVFICIIIIYSYYSLIQIVYYNHLAFDKEMRKREREREGRERE